MNVTKGKVMRCWRDGMVSSLNMSINVEMLEEVSVLKYLGSHVTADGDYRGGI